MAGRIWLQVGSRSARSLGWGSLAATRVARITYCDSEEGWTGISDEARRRLRAELDAREPWFLSLDLRERVAYAGLLGAAVLLELREAESAVFLPLDWVAAPDTEPHGPDAIAAANGIAFAVRADPVLAGRAWTMLDGPVGWVRDARAVRPLLDQADALVRAGAQSCLEKAATAALLQGRVASYHQRCLITASNASAWQDATPAQVAAAFVQAQASSIFVFHPDEPAAAEAQMPLPLAVANRAVGDRLQDAARAKAAVDDPLDRTADPISGVEQRLLRRYLAQAELGVAKRSWKDGFAQWMLCASDESAGLSRLEQEIYHHRPDLRDDFPPRTHTLRGMRRWLMRWGLGDLRLRLIGHSDLEIPPWWRRSLPPGSPRTSCDVHVVGFLDAAFGLATSARSHRDALELSGLSTTATVIPPTGKTYAIPPRVPATCKATLFVVNGSELHTAMEYVDPATVEASHRIGLWAWELPYMPRSYLRGLKYVDELWVPSAFVRDAFRAHTRKPIHVVPHPVRVAAEGPGYDGVVPNAPYFFFAFDYHSSAQRKNPWAVIEAFTAAFPPNAGPHLVIKTRHARLHKKWHSSLLRLARGRGDIHFLDGTWPAALLQHAIRNSLAVVSLHRAEGFGLLLAEAMAYGKPTIATAYSGNLEFQDESNAFLVRHRMVPVPENCAPFKAGQPWADADVDDAARAMRAVSEGGPHVEARAQRAAETIRERLAPEVVGRRMKTLLAEHLERDEQPVSFVRQWRRMLSL